MLTLLVLPSAPFSLEQVHICVKCGSPIAIYGQLLPCRHAFCLNCAQGIGQTCYLCFQKVKSIRRVVYGEQALFPCGVCLRSYDTREELAQAVKEAGGKCCQSQANPAPTTTPML